MLASLKGMENVHVLSRKRNANYDYHFTALDLNEIEQVSNYNFCFEDSLTNAIFINNAGVLGEINTFESVDSKAIVTAFNVNVISPLILMNNFIKTATFQNIKVLIVNITTGLINNTTIPNLSLYIGSKTCMNTMINLISDNCALVEFIFIDPGMVDTPLQEKLRNSDKFGSNNLFKHRYEEKKLRSSLKTGEKIVKFVLSKKWFNMGSYHIDSL
jgi:benzil reductase ((S)-benzoin forming)